jgi:catechol 2,3-dioxygenase-like lactoylglutathione lyase family enzyme
MLGSREIVAFVPTRNAKKARSFYEGVLGLKFISEDAFALVMKGHHTMIRVAIVPNFKPHPFTILGWVVPDIHRAVAALTKRKVHFEQYGLNDQEPTGIWKSPSGASVAWFKDPDGNVLSLTQMP